MVGSVIGALAILLQAVPLAGAEVVALVTDAVGVAEVVRAADEEVQPLHLFGRLEGGDVVRTGADSALVVAFVSGARFEIGSEAEATIVADGLKAGKGELRSLAPVPTVPKIAAIPAAAEPGRRSGAIRFRSASPWGASVENLYPRDGAAVQADRAVLTFTPLSQADGYKVDVEDELGETVFAVETSAPEVVIPAGVLKSGSEYYWRVRTTGRRASGGRGEALFVTLGGDDAGAVAAVESTLVAEGSRNALLLLAEFYRSYGLLREACETLRLVEEKGPAGSEVERARDWFMCDSYQ
jgi:hypothetical protein